MPGSPLDPRTQGTNRLLKQGATLVTSAADVIDVLTPILGLPMPPMREPDRPEPTSGAHADDTLRKRVLELLGPTPVAVDDLVREARAPAGAVQIVLLELELWKRNFNPNLLIISKILEQTPNCYRQSNVLLHRLRN